MALQFRDHLGGKIQGLRGVSGDLCILRFKIFRHSGITVAFKYHV